MRLDTCTDDSQADLDNSMMAGSVPNNSFLPNGMMNNMPTTPNVKHGLADLNSRFADQDDERSYVDGGDA